MASKKKLCTFLLDIFIYYSYKRIKNKYRNHPGYSPGNGDDFDTYFLKLEEHKKDYIETHHKYKLRINKTFYFLKKFSIIVHEFFHMVTFSILFLKISSMHIYTDAYLYKFVSGVAYYSKIEFKTKWDIFRYRISMIAPIFILIISILLTIFVSSYFIILLGLILLDKDLYLPSYTDLLNFKYAKLLKLLNLYEYNTYIEKKAENKNIFHFL